MKKGILCLLIVALIFTAGIVGFYYGRSSGASPVLVERYPQAASTATPTASTAAPETEPPYPVNINSATLQQLQTLPGIGPVLAQRIIDYRNEFGPFETVSQLTMVDGIGVSTLEELSDYITVGGES